MAWPLPFPPSGFDELSADEKIVYVQALWDRIGASHGDELIPDWHLEIVRERLAEHRAHPEAVIPLEEFRDEMDTWKRRD